MRSPFIPTMPDKDWRDTLQACSGAVAAVGSIAIPVALFVVGNKLADRQRVAGEKQVEADRVERMLVHLASDKADEKKLAVRVLEYFVSSQQFPQELLPALVEIASSDRKEDVAATAASVLEKVAAGPSSAEVTAQAKEGLSSLPPRINFHPAESDAHKGERAVSDLSHGGVVVAPQAPIPDSPAQTELRYYRTEDRAGAEKVAQDLQQRGLTAQVKQQPPPNGQQAFRPRSYDLIVGKN
jgi:hypothetical protein